MMYILSLNNINKFDEFIARISDKKAKLDEHRPINSIALQKIKDSLFVEWTYNSNSIEGNTLNLNETFIVLNDGLTIGGKSLNEHLEVINHQSAIELLMQLAHPKYKLNTKDVLEVHRLVLDKIDKQFAGRYRNAGVRISGANFIPPNAQKIDNLMDELINWVNQNPQQLHPIILASVFHHQFVHIHPFFDGNGRTVRLAMNLILLKSGYPPAVILKNDRKKYYSALNSANKGNYKNLFLLMLQAAERSMDIYLSAIPNKGYDNYQPISQIVEDEQLPYSANYVGLLVRQGKIAAHKNGRNWYTNKQAIQNYIDNRKRKR